MRPSTNWLRGSGLLGAAAAVGALLLLSGVAAAAGAVPLGAGSAASPAPAADATTSAGLVPGPDQGANYPVNFTESGLPVNTSWSVTLGSSTLSSGTPTITFSEPNGSYSYTVGTLTGYNASPALGTILVSGAPPTPTTVTFTPATMSTTYAVLFGETGLPNGTNWSVTLGSTTLGSNTSTILFNETNGTYSWSVGAVPGYAPTPATGNLTVLGAPDWQNLTFSPSSGPTYPVVFTESGLPNGTLWAATLAGSPLFSNSTNLTFFESNGTYAWSVGNVTGYTPTVHGGNLTVAGIEVNQSVVFLPNVTSFYPVTFSESGLAAGLNWSVDLNGTNESSTSGTITFTTVNGTYSWMVGTVSGYLPSNSSGAVTVAGLPVLVNLTFAPTVAGTYPLMFMESGLPTGTNWSVTVSDVTRSGTGSTIVFSEPNGTYTFSVAPVRGYSSSPSNGSLVVSGSSVNQPVAFMSSASPPSGGGGGGDMFFGLPAGEGYAVLTGIILLILVVILAAVVFARRRDRGGSGEDDTLGSGTSAGASNRSR